MSERKLTCENCGFALVENPLPDILQSDECIFCGGSYFYLESPLDLSFLGRASICYVCEARYKGLNLDAQDESYKEETARSARKSETALRWKERAERYERQAGS